MHLAGRLKSFQLAQLQVLMLHLEMVGFILNHMQLRKLFIRDGKTEKQLTPNSEVVMKDSTAYMVTDMLRDVLTDGTGKRANVLDSNCWKNRYNKLSDQKVQKIHGLPATQQTIQLLHGADIKTVTPMARYRRRTIRSTRFI